MRDTGDVSPVLRLLLNCHVSVYGGVLVGEHVRREVLREEERDRHDGEFEVVYLVVIGSLLCRVFPPPVAFRLLRCWLWSVLFY